MTTELASSISIFVLALLVGFEVISKIPTTLHTPMMSGANSIHGVVLVGAILVAGLADDPLGYVLAFLAAAFAAMNVVGGYVVTDRMLGMFRGGPARTPGPASPSANAEVSGTPEAAGQAGAATDGAKAAVGGAHEAADRAEDAKDVKGSDAPGAAEPSPSTSDRSAAGPDHHSTTEDAR